MSDVRTPSAADVTAGAAADTKARYAPGLALLQSFVVVVVFGAGLVFAARSGAVALLVAVAIVQGVFALAWVFGTAMPGRWGGLIIAALASGGADVAVSVRPHERLGVLLVVLGLTIPVIFIHQLMRGAARVQIVGSMSAVALLAIAVIGAAASLQIRHEFMPSGVGGKVAATALAAVAGALAVGFVVDVVLPLPRFDADVQRGLLAVLASIGVGAALGYLMLHSQSEFPADRATFVGASLGALAALVSVATSFVLHTTPVPVSSTAARLRPAISALLPLMVLAPAAFLLCLAIRA